MRGLLDLPPELLEHIYCVHNESTEGPERMLTLRNLRRTSRYVEKSTRHYFLTKQCCAVTINTFEDASIERFCAMTATSDIAQALSRIELHMVAIGDHIAQADAPMLQEQSRDITRASIGLPNPPATLGKMVPAALLRHEDSLLKALTACENVDELRFADHIHGDWLDHMPPSHPIRVGSMFYDISSIFDFFMSLVVRAGIHIKRMGTLGIGPSAGLTNAQGMVTGKRALGNIEELDLGFLTSRRHSFKAIEKAGERIGKQLCEGLSDLSTLTSLELKFDGGEMSIFAWKELARVPVLASLQALHLEESDLYMHDLVAFVLKHCNTLTSLKLVSLEFWDGSIDDMRNLLKNLQTSSNLERWESDSLFLEGAFIDFPEVSTLGPGDIRDEDDYLWLRMSAKVFLHGAEEVGHGLRQMVQCIEAVGH